MKILFATAEFRPLVSVGGLGEAAAGLVDGLRRRGHEVEVVVPDYEAWELAAERCQPLDVPEWAGPAVARRGHHAEAGPITLVEVPGMARPNPYVDERGQGWPDNDRRFAAFAAAVAAIAVDGEVDVVQLNDWHTGLVPAFLGATVPTALTIHNLAHQGWSDIGWLHALPWRRDAYAAGDAVNVLAGAVRSVDAVVTVSPTYAAEIMTPAEGRGLHEVLSERADSLLGIRNGIDVRAWDPRHDPLIPTPYGPGDLVGKADARRALLDHVGWADDRSPIVAMVSRLVEQKGVDLAFEAAKYLGGMRARLVVLGSGDRWLGDWGRWLQSEHRDRIFFTDGYDVPLSHLFFAGADLLLMPSRFEPCGLAQMQAMAYGTIPVVTGVGGLADTVVDGDADRAAGTGFVAGTIDVTGVVDALHRALGAWRNGARRRAIVARGMAADWSWDEPTDRYVDLYRRLVAASDGDDD